MRGSGPGVGQIISYYLLVRTSALYIQTKVPAQNPPPTNFTLNYTLRLRLLVVLNNYCKTI